MRLIDMSLPGPTAAPPTLSADALPDDVPTLKRMLIEVLLSLKQRDRDYETLRHRVNLLLQRLYGPRGERFDPSQLLLFAEADTGPDLSATAAAAAEPDTAAKPKRRCRPHGRRQMPDNLPRETRHHELTEAERLCPACGQLRVDIGVDQSNQLEYRPASLFVVEHLLHKYVCPCCRPGPAAAPGQSAHPGQESEPMPTSEPEPQRAPPTATPMSSDQPPEPAAALPEPTASSPAPQAPTLACQLQDPGAVVIAAVKPAMPIAKGLPGPGLLAHLIVSKYVDHLPLHRLERIYERQGLFLARSTLCDWLAACAQLLRPLYARLSACVLQSRALHTDDTPVKMQDPKTHHLSTARCWVYLGDAAHPYNVFDFTVNHKRDGPQQFLASYQGYLHADAFSGYDGLYLPDPQTSLARIIEVACNAHARRKFYEARGTDALGAHVALAYYRQLYELEAGARRVSLDEEGIRQMRQDIAVPILERFHQWLEAQRAEVLPKSPLGEAIAYALRNWTALVRYTEAGYLAIDNNVAEREMKRVAIGRKNWLFVGSAQGGQTATVLLSFTSTCQRLAVEPWAYLQDVLTRLPTTAAGQLDELLPNRWQAARAALAAAAKPAAQPGASFPSTSESLP
jgi:transposase